MAVTQNCLAQNNISTCFNHGRVFPHVANGQVKLQGLNGQTDETNSHQTHFNAAVQKRAVNGILTYIDAAMFCLVPKNWDFKTQMSKETWVSHFSGKASPPCRELHPPVSTSNAHHPSAGEEMPWSFGWFRAELILRCHQGKNGSQGTEKAFARTKLLDKTELCRENKIWNETVRRLTSLLLAPLRQRGPC